MPYKFNFSNTIPSSIYFGNNSVQSIYFGDTLIWPMELYSKALAWYEFEEVSGTTFIDEVGDNNGVIQSGVLINQDGPMGKSHEFTNATLNYDLVYDKNEFTLGNSFALGFWINLDNFNSGKNILLRKVNEYAVQLTSDGRVDVYVYSSGSSSIYKRRYTSTNVITTGTTHNIIFNVIDAYNDSIEVYVDGVSKSLTSANNGVYTGMTNTSQNIVIGATNTTDPPIGRIGQIAIFNNYLTSTELEFYYNSGSGITYSDIITPKPSVYTKAKVWYDYEEVSGTTLVDATGFYDGDIVNSPDLNQDGYVAGLSHFYSASGNTFVRLVDSDFLSFSGETGAIAIAVYPTYFDALTKILVSKYTEYRLDILTNGSVAINFYSGGDFAVYKRFYTPANTITLNNPYFIVVNFDDIINNNVQIYVNNTKQSLTIFEAGTYTGMTNTAQNVYLCANNTYAFNGYIGQTILFNTPIERTEVRYLYNNGNGLFYNDA